MQVNPDSPILWENRASFMENNVSDDPGQGRPGRGQGAAQKEMLLKESDSKDFKVISQRGGQADPRAIPPTPAAAFASSGPSSMEEGYYYQIDLKNPTFKTDKDFDPILRLADDDNRILQEDDDGGGFPNARIFFTPSRTATYKLYVSSSCQAKPGRSC